MYLAFAQYLTCGCLNYLLGERVLTEEGDVVFCPEGSSGAAVIQTLFFGLAKISYEPQGNDSW